MTIDECIENKIKEEIEAIKSAETFHSKMEIQNNILQSKINFPDKERYKADIYSDLKKFVNYYLRSLDEMKSDYDELKYEKIKDYISALNLNEQIKILQYLMRVLRLSGHEDLIDTFEKDLARVKLKKYFSSFDIRHLLSIFYTITTYNLVTVFFSLFFFLLVTVIVLLPAPDWSYPIVEIHYHNYCENWFLNHILNVIGGPIEISEDFKVIPLNKTGFFLCFFGKGLFLILAVNILFKQIEKKIKI